MAKIKNGVTITPEFKVDIRKYGELFCVGLASKVRDDLEEATVSAIQAFYDDYDPVSYRRHYYNFLKKSHKGYYKNPHGMIVRGGVELNPAWMDNIYQDPIQEVFDSVMHGFHGVSSEFVEPKSFTVTKVMSPNPLEIIQTRRDEIVDGIKEYRPFGENRARSKPYQTFNVG